MKYIDFEDIDMEKFFKTVGKNVKDARNSKGLSQLQLANLIGHESVGHVSKAELYLYEKKFNLEQLYKISLVLDVKMEDFFKNV